MEKSDRPTFGCCCNLCAKRAKGESHKSSKASDKTTGSEANSLHHAGRRAEAFIRDRRDRGRFGQGGQRDGAFRSAVSVFSQSSLSVGRTVSPSRNSRSRKCLGPKGKAVQQGRFELQRREQKIVRPGLAGTPQSTGNFRAQQQEEEEEDFQNSKTSTNSRIRQNVPMRNLSFKRVFYQHGGFWNGKTLQRSLHLPRAAADARSLRRPGRDHFESPVRAERCFYGHRIENRYARHGRSPTRTKRCVSRNSRSQSRGPREKSSKTRHDCSHRRDGF